MEAAPSAVLLLLILLEPRLALRQAGLPICSGRAVRNTLRGGPAAGRCTTPRRPRGRVGGRDGQDCYSSQVQSQARQPNR
jgi:hypothetical protein